MRSPEEIVKALRATYRSGRTRPIAWRRAQLSALKRLLKQEETSLLKALQDDLGRSPTEAWTADIALVGHEIEGALTNLDTWTSSVEVTMPLVLLPGTAEISPEPRGVVAILGPWNYPIQLVLAPLVAALAAGNCAVIKPSEHAPASAALLTDLLPRYLDSQAIQVLNGGPELAQALLDQPLDLIFFTGGTEIGRKVMAAAARHLTPVILELGGKSPAIVDKSADLSSAARRLAWGRFLNAGQTCVAPDYVLVVREVAEKLRDRLIEVIRAMYGQDPSKSPDYGKIVSERHLQRLQALLDGQKIVLGGESSLKDRYLAPTLVWDPDPASPLMQEEIFGPILPILPVDSLDQAITFAAERPDPLALYVFSKRRRAFEQVRQGTRSGGLVWNDVIVHLMVPDLPFGGLGPSGMGAYHGRAGFEAMSHRRGVVTRGTFPDPAFRYAPYGALAARVTRWFV